MSTSLRFTFPRHGAVGLAVLLLASSTAMAQPAPPPLLAPAASGPQDARVAPPPPLRAAGPQARRRHPRPAAEAGVAATVSGRVVRWLQNPNGDVDGLLLEDGTQVALPPMQSARVLQVVRLSDTVQVAGMRGSDLAAGPVRATQLRTAAGGTLALEGAEPGGAAPVPPPPREPSALTPMSATGRISTLLYGGRGEINGVLLADGTSVRFPPHVGVDIADDLKVGGTLYARGYGTRNGQGSAFEATRLGRSEGTARDVFSPLAPAGGADAPRRGPAARGGPNEGGPRGDAPPAPPVPPVPPVAATTPGPAAPR